MYVGFRIFESYRKSHVDNTFENIAELFHPEIKMLSAPGDVLDIKSLRIDTVFPDGSAIAETSKKLNPDSYEYAGSVKVLIPPVKNGAYYHQQILTLPSGKIIRQIGTFKGNVFEDTIPIIGYFDK